MSHTDLSRSEGGGENPLTDAEGVRPLPWMLVQKVTVPDRAPGHFDRAELAARVMPTRRRLTVLRAPGGFGKTTLLAECCRRLRDEGVPAAWVSLDERDEPEVLDTYIAYACRRAAAEAPASERPPNGRPGSAPGEAENRTDAVMSRIAELDGPFVLALDELERLTHPGSAALLDFVLRRGPPNLHVALSCRRLPSGVNVAGAVLDGSAEVLTADDLRFSRPEAAELFGGRLPRARLTRLMRESAGWPLALRILRNRAANGRKEPSHVTTEIMGNWIESRLLAGLDAENRDFILDIGLFEWIDAKLADEVLERGDSAYRIESMAFLLGLLEPVGDGAAAGWRLHPMVREHCARLRHRETPQRFEALHRRLAAALLRRGRTVDALGHAVKAGEPALAGDVLERAGGARLYLREGVTQLLGAHRLLNEELVERRPRLGLVRCASLILSGRMDEARARFADMGAASPARLGGDSAESHFAAERFLVRSMLVLYGAEPLDSEVTRSYLAEVDALLRSPGLEPTTRGFLEYSCCMVANMTAAFAAALDHAERARRCFGGSAYMLLSIDMQKGQMAMAQGRARDANALYLDANRAANASYVADAMLVAMVQVMLRELAAECGRDVPNAVPPGIPAALRRGNTPFHAYAAASVVAMESWLRAGDAEGALSSVDGMLAYVLEKRLPGLVRHVSALRASALAVAGRVGEGEQFWRSADLPEAAADCFDLKKLTWRDMESLSSARLRLAIWGGRFAEAREFAEAFRTAAAERGLRRTLMRALALSVALEVRAGDAAAAAQRLDEFLELFAETPYAGPMVLERAHCREVVAAGLGGNADAGRRDAARALTAAMDAADRVLPQLSARERDILDRLGQRQRDKQIGLELGLTEYGVRHHLRSLFDKLGVRRRGDAVVRARELGLLQGEL